MSPLFPLFPTGPAATFVQNGRLIGRVDREVSIFVRLFRLAIECTCAMPGERAALVLQGRHAALWSPGTAADRPVSAPYR